MPRWLFVGCTLTLLPTVEKQEVNGKRPLRLILVAAISCAATLGCARLNAATTVVMVSPRDGATDVSVQSTVQIHLSNGLMLTTVTADSVRLLDASGMLVPAQLGSDIEADVVNIQPKERLKPRATYVLEVNRKLLDKEGTPVTPFRSSFTTGVEVSEPVRADGFQYAKTKIDEEKGPTAIAVGPDGNVYVSTYYGFLYRLQIHPKTGWLVAKETLLTLPGRKILGLTFDPGASASNLVAWITYDDRKAETLDVGTFSGVVSKLLIPVVGRGNGATETQFIIGLPSGWHPLNGCAFGPDQRLYISVGSMNRLGDDPVRPETPLSAAVLVADVRSSKFNGGSLPLNVRTAAPINYDPYASSAPLKLFATGFRQMYRLCWHSNGNLYGGVNQNDGTGRADTPSRPGVPSLHSVFPDEDLVRIVEGGYYGHPNPSRRQYVLLGGNPTASADPWEVPEYPVGVRPEPNFNPANLIFNLKTVNGTSADGCAEYLLPGPLKGRLLICFFEGTHTLHTFAFNSSGASVTDNRPILDQNGESLRFTQPLDVAVHPSGRIYLADFGNWSSFGGGGTIWVLNPVTASDAQLSGGIPAWFRKAPPLPPAQGEMIRVATVEELLAAVDRVGPGGAIVLADGQYKLPRTAVLNEKKNIVIRSASGDPTKVTISGKGWDSQERGDDILHIGHCDGVTIADLTFTDCRSYGIKVEAENSPANIHIYNCRFRDIGVRAIKGSAGQDPKIRAVKGSVRFCYFENTKVPPADWLYGGDYIAAIDMMALGDWTFADNVFRNVKGRNGGGRAAIFIWVRSRKIVVERNLIVNCDRGVAFGNPGQATANTAGERLAYVTDGIIRNNFIAGGPDCGIELWYAEQIKVFNNTIWRPERNWARGIRVGTGTSRSDLANNLVHGEIRLEGGEAQLRQNLARKLDGYFVEPELGNLALARAVPDVIDQGVSAPEVTDDIRGRPRMGKPDLGAWEFERAK